MIESLILLGLAVLAGLVALGRMGIQTYVRATVDKSVSTKFEKELEGVKSDLRVKEGRISALQASLLSGVTGRQAILDKRRIEAVERVWKEVLKLDQLRPAATTISMFKLDVLDKRAPHEENLRAVIKQLGTGAMSGTPVEVLKDFGGESERVFLPEATWNIFSAYRGILVYAYVRIQALAIGIEDIGKLFDDKGALEPVRELMPHLADYISRYGVSAIAHIIDPLRTLVLDSLRAALTAKGGDGLTAIIEEVRQLDEKLTGDAKS